MLPRSLSTAAGDASKTSIVYIIDDDESMQAALRDLLCSVGIRAETFASPREFLAFPKQSNVASCLILDVRLRGESGLAFHQELAKSDMHMPVLFMTGYGDIEMSVKAMKAGAADFFPKPFRDQEMLEAIVHALTRDRERLATEESLASLRVAYDSMTQREHEVMGFVVAGLMNKQIAAEMGLREITVKVHRGQMMRKMSSTSVADLVRKAEALGIKSPQLQTR